MSNLKTFSLVFIGFLENIEITDAQVVISMMNT